MIDPDWLRRIVTLARAETGGMETEPLAALLEDPAEVLPFLLLRGGFAEWPQAMKALRRAVRSFPRATGLPPPGAFAAPPPAEEREALFSALLATLVPPEEPEDEPESLATPLVEEDHEIPLEPLPMLRRIRLHEQRGLDRPSLFIAED